MSAINQTQFVPYPGLRPFTGEEDYLFFGREEQVGELIESLQQHRFVAVVGSSGSGKSSLVRCGLLSEIQGGMMVDAGSEWEITIMQPGGDPLANLAQALIDAELYDEGDETLHQVMATINRSTSGLVEAIKQSNIDNSSNVLLVVDQFEEIFRFHDAGKDGGERAPDFIRRLIQAVRQDDVPLYVILTMRSDFLGDCARFTGLAELINDGEYLVPKLKREQLKHAIEGPAKVAGGQVNRRLVQRLLNDVGEQPDQLPVLQHALMRTWDHAAAREDNESREMDIDDYEAIGAMENALSTHADEVLQEIRDGHEDDTDVFVSRIFKALTEKGSDNRGIRRPTSLRELEAISAAPRNIVEDIINAYRAHGRTFLMPTASTPLADNTVIDISHESLMRVWQRLSHWVEDESQSVRIYQRLAETSELWSRGEAGLYRDPDLQIALGWMESSRPNAAWAKRFDGSFETALDFLEESDASQNAEQREAEETRQRELLQAQKLAEAQELRAREQARSTRRFRLLSGIIGVIAVFAIVASVMAYFAMQEAEQNELQTKQLLTENQETLRKLSESQKRDDIEEARRLFDNGDFYGAVRVLDKANKRAKGDADLLIELARMASENNTFRMRPFAFDKLPFSPNRILKLGDKLAAVDDIGNLVIGDSKNTTANPIENQFPSSVLKASVQGETVYASLEDGRIFQYQSETDEQSALWDILDDSEGLPELVKPSQVTFSGTMCAIHNANHVWILDLANTPTITASHSVAEDTAILSCTFSDDQSVVFLIVDDSTYRVVDISEEPKQIRSLPVNSEVVFQDYLPLQKKLLAIEEDGLIQLIDIHDPLLDMVIDGGDVNQMKQFDVSPDSTRIAMLSLSGELSVMELANGDYFFKSLPDDRIRLSQMNFDSSGVYVVGVDFDNRLNVIDSESGVSVVFPSDAQVHTTYIPTSLIKAPESPSMSVLGVTAIETDSSAGTPSVVRLSIHHSSPVATEFELDLEAIRESLSDVSQEELHRAFSSAYRFLIGSNEDLGGMSFFDPPGQGRATAKFIVDWLFRRPSIIDNEFYDWENSSHYWSNRAANGQSVSLSKVMLSGQLNEQTLAAAINMPGEKGRIPAGHYSARYHQLRHLNSIMVNPDGTSALNEAVYSNAILKQLAGLDNLLEIRSMAYEDQIHEGETIRLDDAEHVGYWDAIANRWEIEEGSVKTPEITATFPDSANQYAIWRGGEFADVRVSFNYKLSRGNSGLTFRGSVPRSLKTVFGSSHLHGYLQQGYQADFVFQNDFDFKNFSGTLVSDNFNTLRRLTISNRGESAIILRNRSKSLLNRNEMKTSDQLLSTLDQDDDLKSMTLVSRGSRIDMFIQSEPLNTTFDFASSRLHSGLLSFQSRRRDTVLSLDSILVVPLGRDIAESELQRQQAELTDQELKCKLLFARKRWNVLRSELQLILESENNLDWAVTMLRSVNLEIRDSHRRLAKACMTNDLESLQAIIDEIGSSDLLNNIAHSEVGIIGRGNWVSTPVMAASFEGHVDALKLLFENGVVANVRAGIFEYEPTFAACIANQKETLKFLLENGCDPNAANRNQHRVLHEATKWADPELVQVLLDAGAQVNNTDGRGWTALQDLARVSAFLKPRGDSRELALHAISERRLHVAKLLMEKGTESDNPYGSSQTAIEIAEEAGDTEMVELLKTYSKK